MITDFKLFEKEGDKFKIGDWILLDDDLNDSISGTNDTLNISAWCVYPYVRIIDKESTKTHNDEDEETLNDYYVESFDLKTNEFKQFWVDDYEINRKLTKEEIKDTKIRIAALKYNL